MNRSYINIFLMLTLLSISSFSLADEYKQAIPLISGAIKTTKVKNSETLMEIALREGFGFNNVINSNHQHDPWKPGAGEEILLPGQAITPYGAEAGIFINLAELRLFHISGPGQQIKVDIYPLGIGRSGRETPEGTYRVVIKKEKPDWRVPAGLRAEDNSLPAVVPPGPDNPLGNFWLGLSAPGYGVHGTNRPYGVGRRISYGCLRMYPDDIGTLYNEVTTGTKVIIGYQPVKAAAVGNHLLLEVHPDYLKRHNDLFQAALTAISKTGWREEINYGLVKNAVLSQKGIPVIVSSRFTKQ